MFTKSAPLLRIWRVQPWSANSLMRGSDRGEAALRLLLVIVALLMVPVAGAIGTATYDRSSARIAAARATSVEVTAVLTGPPAAQSATGPYRAGRYEAPARWEWQHLPRTGEVAVDEDAKAGAPVHIWVGPEGDPVTAPPAPGTAASDAVGTGLAVLLLGWCVVLALAWSARMLLEHFRSRRLDVEWRRLAKPVEK